MSNVSFIEVVGGKLIATSQVAFLSVEPAGKLGYNVILNTILGHQWIFATCEEEDEAFGKMHRLAESVGPVLADE